MAKQATLVACDIDRDLTLQFVSRDDLPDYLTLDDVSVFPVAAPILQIARSKSGTTVQLTWSATVGLSYQLQSAPTLANPVWSNVGSPVTATANTVSALATAGGAQQFYRVELELQ